MNLKLYFYQFQPKQLDYDASWDIFMTGQYQGFFPLKKSACNNTLQ